MIPQIKILYIPPLPKFPTCSPHWVYIVLQLFITFWNSHHSEVQGIVRIWSKSSLFHNETAHATVALCFHSVSHSNSRAGSECGVPQCWDHLSSLAPPLPCCMSLAVCTKEGLPSPPPSTPLAGRESCLLSPLLSLSHWLLVQGLYTRPDNLSTVCRGEAPLVSHLLILVRVNVIYTYHHCCTVVGSTHGGNTHLSPCSQVWKPSSIHWACSVAKEMGWGLRFCFLFFAFAFAFYYIKQFSSNVFMHPSVWIFSDML